MEPRRLSLLTTLLGLGYLNHLPNLPKSEAQLIPNSPATLTDINIRPEKERKRNLRKLRKERNN